MTPKRGRDGDPIIQLPLELPEQVTPTPTPTSDDIPISVCITHDADHLIQSGPQLDMDLALRAHTWNSFTPEKRAQQGAEYVRDHLRGVYDHLTAYTRTDEQRSTLVSEFTRYQEGYIQRYHAVLEAKSRTASPMVTGPARFPTARNRKHLETEYRRSEELYEWQERALKAMVRAILQARSAEQVQEDEWNTLKLWIDRDMATVASIDTREKGFAGFNRNAFVTSTADKIRRLAESGDVALAAQALAYVREQQAGLSKPFITDRNSIWNVVQQVEERQGANPAKTGQEVIAAREGLKVLRNHDADRLQLIFDEIPAATTREQLKRSGWNWSRTEGAWQRKITPNAEYALRRFLDGLDMPRESETRGR